jgi:hypothetical protein
VTWAGCRPPSLNRDGRRGFRLKLRGGATYRTGAFGAVEAIGNSERKINMTSSALTKRIQRRERQLSVVLVDRTPAGYRGLTVAGARFAVAARPLLACAQDARRAARAATPQPITETGPVYSQLTAADSR